MRRLPVIPTIIVALAVATMAGLGVWQLQRATWKEELLSRYEANRNLPPLLFPPLHANTEHLLFRRVGDICDEPTIIRVMSGRSMAGTSGWSHITRCRSAGRGKPDLSIDIGWSAKFDAPNAWIGGVVEGILVPAGKDGIKLIATTPAPGLAASLPPSPDTISNNHRFYAAQWFFFAGIAGLIYWLALRRRRTSQTGSE